MPLNGTSIGLTVAGKLSVAGDLGVSPVAALPPYAKLVELINGTGAVAGQADRLFYDQRTLAPSATEDFDLTGVQVDAFGVAITLARIKAIFISAVAANTNNVIVGAASANQWVTLLNATGTVTLRPGATFAAFAGAADAAGYLVTGATGDLLKVANSGAGTSVDYEIVIIGASA